MPAATRPRPARRLSPGRRTLAGACAVVAVVALAGCGSSGRALREPAPGATAPPRKSSASTTATTPPAAIGLSIVSPAWAPGQPVPGTFSCDGAGTSPPLVVSGSGGSAVELVVVVTDPDAGGRVHWVVAGLDPGGATFPQGGVPTGAVVGRNSAGTSNWEALCPPSGETHTYEFVVHALAQPSGITESTPATEAERLVVGAESSAAMTGSYTRTG